VSLITVVGLLFATSASIYAMDSARAAPLPQSTLFPPDNWWNLDISNWPVDSNSSSYIAFINNGGPAGSIQTLAATRERRRDPTRSTVFHMRLFQMSPMLTFALCNLPTLARVMALITLEIPRSRSIHPAGGNCTTILDRGWRSGKRRSAQQPRPPFADCRSGPQPLIRAFQRLLR
jgi:hypothetical protein